jgi:ribose transport system permease protein
MNYSTVGSLAKPFQRVPELGLFMILISTIGLITLANPFFASVGSFEVILVTILYTGIIVIGQTMLMIVGEIDLSVGAVASLGSVSTGLMMTKLSFPTPVAIMLGILVGAAIGFINGFITVKIQISAFITTLAMLFLARGISYVLSGGDPVYPLPENAGVLSRTEILGLPSSVWIFLILFLASDVWLRTTVSGRKLYLIGGNQVAARLSGIKVHKIKIILFTFTGALSAFAGILLMSKLERSDSITGLGWELNVIAAVAVGGILLTGGGGSLTGAFLGLFFLQVVSQGLVMLGFDAFLLEAVTGSVMILAVLIVSRRKVN